MVSDHAFIFALRDLIDYMKRYRMDRDRQSDFRDCPGGGRTGSTRDGAGRGLGGCARHDATAGPGMSLMAEFAGFGYYVEIPAVICDVQRVGPSTGLPTRTQQGDFLSTAFLSHGDTKHPMFFPCSVVECFAFGDRSI